MKQVILLAALLLASCGMDAQNKKNEKIELSRLAGESRNSDSILIVDANSTPAKNEQNQGKVVVIEDGGATSTKYVYRLRHRAKKTKTWYDPTVDPKSLDNYIAEGWEVARVKNLNAPPFFKQLLEWIRIGLGIVREWFGPTSKSGGTDGVVNIPESG